MAVLDRIAIFSISAHTIFSNQTYCDKRLLARLPEGK
jgi:hypothetical protein